MKKLGKIIFVCFLCIGIIKGNEGALQADEGDTFTAYIEIGGQLVETTFKVLSEANGSTKGTVQIGDGTNTAIDRNTAGDMVIPEVVKDSGTGKSYDVTDIGGVAFLGCTSLKSAGLESNNTVTEIGHYAFFGCTSLTSTGLEDNSTVTDIGWNVFRGCTSLKSTGLESNNTVTKIGEGTFYDCISLTSTGLKSNNKVTEIGGGAFNGCTSLKSTGLESNTSVTDIGFSAFEGCTSLKSTGLESNSTVTDIGGYAFEGCTSLTSTGLESNNTITKIGDSAFKGCTSLKSTGLSVKSKVTQIGYHAFFGCDNLKTFIFKNDSIPTIGTIGIEAFPSDIETYYFEGATGIENLADYNSTKIKVDSIKVVDETYHEGETFTPNGLKFRIGYSKTSGTGKVSDIVDYNNSKNEFKVNEVTLKSDINEIDVEYLNEQVTLTLDVEAHTYGEWIIDKEATLSEDGEKHTLCSVCNNKKTERIPMLSDESSYTITSGSNQTWQKGSKNMVSFTIDAKVENFEGIKIDGKTINKELYTVKSGSTIIELKTEYLNTLNKGKYEIVFVFKGNEVATSFEVIEATVIDNKIPDTGDQTNISLYIGMMMLALGGCIWLKKVRS